MKRFKEADYDLNIYRTELDSDNPDVIRYSKVWYLQVFEHRNNSQYEVTKPIKLSFQEREALNLGRGYFSDQDHWYGLEGFVKDYGHSLSVRLIKFFNLLP